MRAPERAGAVTLRPSVTVRHGPERGFVFDQRTGRVYSLNATAALAAARLAQGASLAAVAAALVEAFEADPATVRADLDRFCTLLVEEGLAERHG